MKALKIVGLIFVALIGAWFLLEDYWYRKAIPENISLSYRISITSDSGIREGCGTAVYKLGDKAAKSIKERGVKFLRAPTTRLEAILMGTIHMASGWRLPGWTGAGQKIGHMNCFAAGV